MYFQSINWWLIVKEGTLCFRYTKREMSLIFIYLFIFLFHFWLKPYIQQSIRLRNEELPAKTTGKRIFYYYYCYMVRLETIF